jgi:hypothetical protein
VRPLAHVGSALVGWPLLPELVSAPAAEGPGPDPSAPVVHFKVGTAGCLHADEDGTGSVAPGGTVGRLDDISGSGYHAGQATSGNRPTLINTGGPLGDALELVFSGNWLSTAEVTTPAEGTLVLVGRASGSGGLAAHHSTPGGSFKGDYWYNPGEAMGYRGQYPNASVSDLPFAPSSSVYYVWVLVVRPGAVATKNLYTNGSFVANVDTNIGTDPLVGPVVLGALDADGLFPGNLRLLEFRRYNRALDAGEIATLSAALMAEHNIT